MSGDKMVSGAVEQQVPEGAGQEAVGELNVGHHLRLARENKGVSVDEVCAALKLSPRQVEAIEANDWSRLPKTIVRGFVRNYARYLEIDAVPLMAALDGQRLPQNPELAVKVGTPVNMPQEGAGDRKDYARVLAGAVVLLLALSAYFLVPPEMWRQTLESIKEIVHPTKKAADPAVEPAADAGKAPATDVAAPAPVVIADTPAPPDAPAPVANEAPAAPAAPQPAANALVFSFSQPSWVEVRDRTGQIIFSQLSPAGSRREITGQPPFALVVGNATHVTLQYKGKSVDLSKRSKDDVARLTLE